MKKRFVFAAVGGILVALVGIFVAEYALLEPILFGHYETHLKSTIVYNKIPEEQWIQMYSNHTSVKDFVEKFENHTIRQELTFGHKKITYEHVDRNIITQLTVHVGSDFNEFMVFYCSDEEDGFGWPVPMEYAIFIEELDCHKMLPNARKFFESQNQTP